MNHYSRGDDLSYRFDCPLAFRHSSSPPFLPAHQVYSSPTQFVSACPTLNQFSGSMYDQVYQNQIQMAYRPEENLYFNADNPGWGAQPDFSWQPHPVVTPVTQGYPFVDAPCYDQPYPQYQPSPTTYSPFFEEKVLQAFDQPSYLPPHQTHPDDDRFAQFEQSIMAQQQSIMAQQQSLDESMDHTDHLLIQLHREEEGELPSQPESNLEGPYLAHNFNDPQKFPEQPTMPFGDELVFEQLCTAIKTNMDNLTKAEKYLEKLNWWSESISSLPHLPMAPLPSALESSTSFHGMGEQIDAMMELVETSQEPPMNNTIEEATPKIFSQDLLDPCLAHLGMDDFNPIKIPYYETTPLWIKQHELALSPSIAPLLESPPTLELKPLPDTPIDTLPVIPNQEAQLVGIL